MSSVMLCGPFSILLRQQQDGGYRFSEVIKPRIEAICSLLEGNGYEILSAHRADCYGELPWDQDFVQRDLRWAELCDAQLVLLPGGPEGEFIRSDGTMIELGFATARGKPIILLADDLSNPANSFFIRSFGQRNVVASIPWTDGFESDLLRSIADATSNPFRPNLKAREHRTHVNRVLEELRNEQLPHDVKVGGMHLTVLPGVLSPSLSHAPDALMSKWTIPPNGCVLDLGCGSGVLGLAALRQGAARLVALDINPQAVRTTTINLTNLGLSDLGDARLSNCYSALANDEMFDVIIFAAPYWDRVAVDDLERSCFDEGYGFFSAAITEAHNWLKDSGAMYVVFSDQGDVSRALEIIDDSALRIEKMHLFRPTQPNGHIRIVWDLRLRVPT